MRKKLGKYLFFCQYNLFLIISIAFLVSCSNTLFDQKINLTTNLPKNQDEYYFNKYFLIAIDKQQDSNLKIHDYLEYNLSYNITAFLSNLSKKVMRESTTLTGNFIVKRNGKTLFKFVDKVHSSYIIESFSYETQRIREENRLLAANTLANSASVKLLLKYNNLDK